MRLLGLLSVFIIAGFMFNVVERLHPPGQPLGNEQVFTDRGSEIIDLQHVNTMDDYYLRNGQMETGSNNLVTSVVFDYRGFDTIGEAAVLFLVVTSVSMLLFGIMGKSDIEDITLVASNGFPEGITRIVSIGAVLMLPIIMVYGAYLILHGHLSPGGGFQGGAVMATGTALLLVSSYMANNVKKNYTLFSITEAIGLLVFVSVGLFGLGSSFLHNFLANSGSPFLGRTIEFGTTAGYLNSGGVLPILSTGVGLEVYCGISIILILMNRALITIEKTNGGRK